MRSLRQPCRVLAAGWILAASLAAAAAAQPAAPDGEAWREDRGDLIVLHLAGSYEEIGRQEARLMEPELRAVYAWQRAGFDRAVATRSALERVIVAAWFPLWSLLAPHFEASGFTRQLHGMADGLGIPRREMLRAAFGLVAEGSTVFAATRSATASGGALIGRNVDWSDAFGRRRPVVECIRPSAAGDLAYVATGWPLEALPTVGVNEAGFALSFNYFETDPEVSLWLPRWPHRRALQRARSVEEGIRIFQETPRLGIATFMVMADAAGDIAMVECTTTACAVFRPDGDWFAQSNHARTEAMIPHDRYRSVDSFDRRAAMEAAVAARLGRLDPASAAEILRDRSNLPWANASTVGNLSVLNAAVVEPASHTLWHSTTMQPHAPFGAYAPFTAGRDTSEAAPLPADPGLDGPALRREAELVARARTGLGLYRDGRFEEAAELWDDLAALPDSPLDPARLAFARALARWRAGELDRADALLAEVTPGPGRHDVLVNARVAQARLADAGGHRAQALALYHEAAALLDAHPEYDVYASLRRAIASGLAEPASDPAPPSLGWLLRIPE